LSWTSGSLEAVVERDPYTDASVFLDRLQNIPNTKALSRAEIHVFKALTSCQILTFIYGLVLTDVHNIAPKRSLNKVLLEKGHSVLSKRLESASFRFGPPNVNEPSPDSDEEFDCVLSALRTLAVAEATDALRAEIGDSFRKLIPTLERNSILRKLCRAEAELYSASLSPNISYFGTMVPLKNVINSGEEVSQSR